MTRFLRRLWRFLLDLLFPCFCLNCGREGEYICEDCQATLSFFDAQYCLCESPSRVWGAGRCQKCSGQPLDGLFCALNYDSLLVKKLIGRLKYPPQAKSLAKTCASLIITHFLLMDKPPTTFRKESGGGFTGWVLVPVPLCRKRLKWRGFNQSEEIASCLSVAFGIEVWTGCLRRIKEARPQAGLSGVERKENTKGAFALSHNVPVKGQNILLVDDVYTTGSTMQECAKVLKEAGARQVVGVVVARG